MNSKLGHYACGLLLLSAVTTTRADSTWNYFITDAGGGNSLVTWNVSGDLTTPPGAFRSSNGPLLAVPVSAPGMFTDSYVADGTPQSLTTPDGSYFSRLGGLQGPLSGYYTYNAAGGGDDGFGLMVPLFVTHIGDLVTYYPGTQSAIVPVPYSDFNPGMYESQMFGFSSGLTVNLTVGTVPEPGMGALFALGAISALVVRRRAPKGSR